MKKGLRKDTASPSLLTKQALQKLEEKGFLYVLVRGFTRDWKLDYVTPHYFLLVPVKELPQDIENKDVYEPIDSQILRDWAEFPGDGVEVLIAKH